MVEKDFLGVRENKSEKEDAEKRAAKSQTPSVRFGVMKSSTATLVK